MTLGRGHGGERASHGREAAVGSGERAVEAALGSGARGGRGGEQQARSEAERAALHGGDFCGPDAGEMDRGERRKTKKKLNK